MSQVSIIDITSNNPQIPTSFTTDDGSAIPIANVLEILGSYVPAGILPVYTSGSGNTVTVNVQIAQAIAASNVLNIGLAAFDSTQFNVDANGFVTLNGGGSSEAFNIDASTAPGTDPVVPSGGIITVTGAQVAAGTVGANVIRTNSIIANSYQIEIQRSAAVAGTNSINNGVSHFDSSKFTVDANGFVSLTSTGVGQTITGDTGGALSPTASNWNILGSGSITTAGAVSTLTVALTGLTNHAVLVGAGTSTITKVGPTATAGQVLQSAGAAADPAFSTATYPSTTTINQILYSSAANTITGLATGNNGVLITSATGVPSLLANGTTGQVLTATTGSEPTWTTVAAGVTSVTGTANQILASPTTGAVVVSLILDYKLSFMFGGM